MPEEQNQLINPSNPNQQEQPTPPAPQPLAPAPIQPKSRFKLPVVIGAIFAVGITALGVFFFINKAPASEKVASSTPPESTLTKEVIPELDIEVQLPADVAEDVNFNVNSHDGSAGGEEALSDKPFFTIVPVSGELLTQEPECDASNISLGYFAAYDPTSRVYLNRAEPGDGEPAENIGTQIGSYVYDYNPPQATCATNSQAAQDLENALVDHIKEAFDTLTAAPPTKAVNNKLVLEGLDLTLSLGANIGDLTYHQTADGYELSSPTLKTAILTKTNPQDWAYCLAQGLGRIEPIDTPMSEDPNVTSITIDGKHYSYLDDPQSCVSSADENKFMPVRTSLIEAVRTAFKAAQ